MVARGKPVGQVRPGVGDGIDGANTERLETLRQRAAAQGALQIIGARIGLQKSRSS